jgi:hypothetical protein
MKLYIEEMLISSPAKLKDDKHTYIYIYSLLLHMSRSLYMQCFLLDGKLVTGVHLGYD